MKILKLQMGDSIDRNIDEEWDGTLGWSAFIKSLDQNITNVYFDPADLTTTIYFRGEEHKIWFLLRYS